MNNEETFLVLLVVLITGVLVWSVFGFFQTSNLQNTPQNYQKFVANQNPNDICATPAGYTDAQWREHMSHHPDQYAQCLNK